MPLTATQDEIEACLTQIQHKVRCGQDGKDYTFIPRSKTRQAMADAGLTYSDLRTAILELDWTDCFNGPSVDRDRPGTGDLWEFGKYIDTLEFYVKIKIATTLNQPVIILSFHRPDRPIFYPNKP